LEGVFYFKVIGLSVRKVVFWILGLYVLLLIASFAWAFATLKSTAAAGIEDKVVRPKVGYNFGTQSETVFQTVFVNDTEVPRDPRFSTTDVETIDDFDRVVFLLDGFASAKTNQTIQYFGYDADEIAALDSDSTHTVQSATLTLRLHLIPLIVTRKHAVFIDFSDFQKTYREDCLFPIINNTVMGEFDKEFRNECRKAP